MILNSYSNLGAESGVEQQTAEQKLIENMKEEEFEVEIEKGILVITG
jgi:hypothetical protein